MTLLDAVHGLTSRVASDDLDPKDTDAVFRRIQLEAPGLDPVDVRRLQSALAAFERAVRSRQDDMQAQLDHSGRGRRAMRGYGYLRSHKTGQRVRKKA